MKIRIEVSDGLAEDEVLIRCAQVDGTIRRIHKFISEQTAPAPGITFYKQNREFYFPVEDVLFFETDGEHIYAHTENDSYRIKQRLFELERILPRSFVRASKSAIVNAAKVYSVTRSLTSSSLVQFANSHKQIYASRHYYGALRQRLSERSSYER